MDNYRIMNGLVDNATSETLNAPDNNAMREVSELVRARADMPKEVIKLINSKLMKRDKKVTMLSLELLEYLTYTCEITLFNQIATKDFLIKMGNVLRYNDLGEQVILRACCLIKCWRDLFNKDLHQFFFQFYDNLIKKGIDIPSNYVSPYAGLRSNLPATSSSFGSNNFKPSSQSFGQSSSNRANSSAASGPNAKLKTDLELIKKNITAVNEMIDSQDPRGNVDQNYELSNLVQTIKNSETMTVNLIEKLALENEEDLLSLCLQINDDMQDTFERHQSLRRHQKPKPFRGKKVEEEVLKQIEQLEISSKINNQSQASIFAETAQTLSQGLQQAQQQVQKLPPPMQPPVQPPQPQKPVANLIDLLDDDEPVTVPQKPSAPTSFPAYPPNAPATFQQPPQQFQQPPQQFQQPPQQFQQPPQQFQQPPQQFQQPPQNGGLTQLYQQQQQQQAGYPPQQQQQQQPQQNKYAALNSIGQPQMGGYNPVQYNPNTMGQQGYGNPQQFGYNNPQQPVYQPQQQPTGYGVPPINNGYGATTSFTSPPVVGGYGGGLPNQNKTGYGAPPVKKSDAFDDLDDMFGIGGNSAPSNTKPAQQPQAAKQVDFDLF